MVGQREFGRASVGRLTVVHWEMLTVTLQLSLSSPTGHGLYCQVSRVSCEGLVVQGVDAKRLHCCIALLQSEGTEAHTCHGSWAIKPVMC
jgi:hypothetical protein